MFASRIFLYLAAAALMLLALGIASSLPKFRKTAGTMLSILILVIAVAVDIKTEPKKQPNNAKSTTASGTLVAQTQVAPIDTTPAKQASTKPLEHHQNTKQESPHATAGSIHGSDNTVLILQNQQPSPTYEQKCQGSACAQGPNSQATYNQYGASKPGPNILELTKKTVPAIPRPAMPVFAPGTSEFEKQLKMSSFKQEFMMFNPENARPGSTASFYVAAPFTNPKFLVVCTRPCVGTEISFSFNNDVHNGGTASPAFNLSSDRVVFTSGYQASIDTVTQITVMVRSVDDQPIAITKVESYVQ